MRLFRRGKNPTTWSPFRRPLREYLPCTRAYTRKLSRIPIHTCARAYTFLPACSRVQIGIEKSRSQLKLRAQRIRRDKIPIISCPRRRPLPHSPFPARPANVKEGKGASGGGEGGGFPCKNSIPLGIEVSKTRMGIYITHSHLAYLPNKGSTLPPPSSPARSSPATLSSSASSTAVASPAV